MFKINMARLRSLLHLGIGSGRTWVTKIVENPYLQFWTGVILLVSVLTDILHLHFGLIVVSVANILSAVPPMMQAAERILKADDKFEEEE